MQCHLKILYKLSSNKFANLGELSNSLELEKKNKIALNFDKIHVVKQANADPIKYNLIKLMIA